MASRGFQWLQLRTGASVVTVVVAVLMGATPAGAQGESSPSPPVVVVDQVDRDQDGGVVLTGRFGFGAPAGTPGAPIPVPAGDFDPGFANEGTAMLPVEGASVDLLAAPDASTLVLVATGVDHEQALVVALGPDGTLDPAYGADGTVLIGTEDAPVEPTALVPRPDGGALVVGSGMEDGKGVGVVFGLTPGGEIDQSWGVDGAVVVDDADGDVALLGATSTPLGAVFVGSVAPLEDGDGVVLAVGYDHSGTEMWGQTGGQPDFDSVLRAAAVQPDGKVVATGEVSDAADGTLVGYALFRFLVDGTPDPDFPNTYLHDNPTQHCLMSMSAVVIQGLDSVVAGRAEGCAGQGDGTMLLVARQDPDGVIDLPFGAPLDDPAIGEGATGFPGQSPDARWSGSGIGLDALDRIVAVGTSEATPLGIYEDQEAASDWPRPVVVRLHPGGQEDRSFESSYLALADFERPWSLAAVRVLEDAVIVVGTQVVEGVERPVLSRLAGVGPASVTLSWPGGAKTDATTTVAGEWQGVVPNVLEPGVPVTVTFTDTDGRVATTEITAPPIPGAVLPATGTSAATVIGAAIGLILLGALATATTRRYASTPERLRARQGSVARRRSSPR